MAIKVTDFVEPVYEHLRANAGKDDETGVLVTHAPLHPWLMDTYDLTESQAKRIRTETVRALTIQGRVRRDHPNSMKVWVLQ